MALPIILSAGWGATKLGARAVKGTAGLAGGAIGGAMSGAKFVASLPKKLIDAAIFGPLKIVKMLTGVIGKGFGLVGISTSLSSLLRQSQIFTGSIGALLQMIGAFIDIMLAPFMPAFGRLIGKMGTWVPKIQEFSAKFYEWVTGSAWPFLKELPRKIIEHFGGSWDVLMGWWNSQNMSDWMNDPMGMLRQTWDKISPHLVSGIETVFTTLKSDIGSIYSWASDWFMNGKAALTEWWESDGSEIWEDWKTEFEKWWDGPTGKKWIGEKISGVWTTVTDWWDGPNGKEWITEKIGAAWTTVTTWWDNINWKETWDAVWSVVEPTVTAALDLTKGALGGVLKGLLKYLGVDKKTIPGSMADITQSRYYTGGYDDHIMRQMGLRNEWDRGVAHRSAYFGNIKKNIKDTVVENLPTRRAYSGLQGALGYAQGSMTTATQGQLYTAQLEHQGFMGMGRGFFQTLGNQQLANTGINPNSKALHDLDQRGSDQSAYGSGEPISYLPRG